LNIAIRLSPNDPILWTMENARSGSSLCENALIL
jgi:hypothetical protein